MKPIRRGRKEDRRSRSAFASQRPPTTDPVYLKRTVGKTDPQTLIDGVSAGQLDLQTLAADLHRESYCGGLPEEEWAHRIFDTSLARLWDLPPALLDAKEELPSLYQLPTSRADLDLWLRRLMVVSDREHNIDILVEGWGSSMASSSRAFDRHVTDLWKLRETEQLLYDALVGGRFGSVVRYFTEKSFKFPPCISKLLLHQSLIWCAHDVQMIIARLSKPIAFGSLVRTYSNRHTPERSINEIRRTRLALEDVLDVYFQTNAWRNGIVYPPKRARYPDLRVSKDPIVRRLAKVIVRNGKIGGINACLVERFMQQIATSIRDNDSLMIARSQTPISSNQEEKDFTKEWYGVPSRLTAAMVAIRRLVQAEHALPSIVNSLSSKLGFGADEWARLALPGYKQGQPRGTETRLSNLMNFYRDVIWGQDIEDRASDTNLRTRKAENESQMFLVSLGDREPGDHAGLPNDVRRSFYLLDVIPEHRFRVSGS